MPKLTLTGYSTPLTVALPPASLTPYAATDAYGVLTLRLGRLGLAVDLADAVGLCLAGEEEDSLLLQEAAMKMFSSVTEGLCSSMAVAAFTPLECPCR